MSKPIEVRQHDTGKPFEMTLVDGKGRAFPLNPAWPIWFIMAPAIPGLPGNPQKFKKAAQYVADGQVRYQPDAADVAFAGPYKAECEVITPLGPLTFPKGYWDIIILADLG